MKRWLLVLVACSKRDEEPVRDGVSRVHVHLRDTYLDLTYTAKLPAAPDPLIANKAACQVGSDRFVARIYGGAQPAPNVATEVEDHPFITEPLPEKPSMCELELYGEHFCMTEDSFKRGACAPNAVTGASVHGLSARLVSVKGEDKDSLGFPAHLTVEYVFTAHADMPKGAYAVRRTTCDGSSRDDTWHSEAELLRAGESFRAAQNTYRLGRPAPGTPCRTTFGFSPVVEGEITVVGEACHVDDKLVPCR